VPRKSTLVALVFMAIFGAVVCRADSSSHLSLDKGQFFNPCDTNCFNLGWISSDAWPSYTDAPYTVSGFASFDNQWDVSFSSGAPFYWCVDQECPSPVISTEYCSSYSNGAIAIAGSGGQRFLGTARGSYCVLSLNPEQYYLSEEIIVGFSGRWNDGSYATGWYSSGLTVFPDLEGRLVAADSAHLEVDVPAPVPEPCSFVLLGLGILGFLTQTKRMSAGNDRSESQLH
jgi:hypothetical protein